jgi:acetyl/propionyl-CoA carboxylase alpha subunit
MVSAPFDGKIMAVHLEEGELVEQGDLVVDFEERKKMFAKGLFSLNRFIGD